MDISVLPRSGKPAGNTATVWLKIIALVFMFIDHAGKMLFPAVPEMRMLGRIAFPVYVWCMIVGFHYTRSVPKYLLRVLIVGLISQPLYMLALNHTWSQPNVFLTLFLGLCALWGIRERKCFSQLWAPAAALILAIVLNADYGWKGVLFILFLYACRSSRPAIAAMMISFFLFWGTTYRLTSSLFGIPIDLDALPNQLNREGLSVLGSLVKALLTPVSSFLRMETYALLSLPLILIRFRKRLRLPVWVSYGLYPAHLLLIMLLKSVF